MPPNSKHRAGNLTAEAWEALRVAKFANTNPAIQPTLSDAAIAAVHVAQNHPDEYASALAERKTTT